MDGHERRKKMLLGGGMALLIGVGISCCCLTDSQLQATERPVVTRDVSGKNLGVKPVAGLEQAEAQRDVRNPFSIMHETEKDPVPQAQTVQPANVPAAGTPAMEHPAPESVGAGERVTVPAMSSRPVLCGLAQGNHGKLVMIRIGSQTVTAGVGEWAGSWQIREITDTAVVLDDGTETESLQLMPL